MGGLVLPRRVEQPGRHLPVDEVSDEIAAIRGLGPGEDSISPSRQPDIASRGDLRRKVEEMRELTDVFTASLEVARFTDVDHPGLP